MQQGGSGRGGWRQAAVAGAATVVAGSGAGTGDASRTADRHARRLQSGTRDNRARAPGRTRKNRHRRVTSSSVTISVLTAPATRAHGRSSTVVRGRPWPDHGVARSRNT